MVASTRFTVFKRRYNSVSFNPGQLDHQEQPLERQTSRVSFDIHSDPPVSPKYGANYADNSCNASTSVHNSDLSAPTRPPPPSAYPYYPSMYGVSSHRVPNLPQFSGELKKRGCRVCSMEI